MAAKSNANFKFKNRFGASVSRGLFKRETRRRKLPLAMPSFDENVLDYYGDTTRAVGLTAGYAGLYSKRS
jgi:hypothetical protein